MKPIYLEMQAFGPFVEKQTVDFEKLSGHGIFLIKGPTGSGKTTIFDAMTVALYGGGSGEDEKSKTGRNDFEAWRCNQADPKIPTYVMFDFEVKGVRYRFTRRLIPKRVNLSAQYEAGAFNKDGVLIPFFDNPKKEDLNNKAVELIGLTKEQFRQVVLLPQGQFERFLTASSNEKEAILQKVFNTERWGSYTQRLYEIAKNRKDELDAEKNRVKNSLQEENVQSLTELEQHIGVLRQKQQDLHEAHIAFDGEARQRSLQADQKLFEQFKPLHDLESRQVNLAARAEEMLTKKSAYEQAEKAEKLRSVIDTFESNKDAFDKRQKELEELANALPFKSEELEKARVRKQTHDELSPVPELQKKTGVYEQKIPVYESCAKLEEEFESASSEYDKAKEKLDHAKQDAENQKKTCSKLLDLANQAEREAVSLRQKYFAGIYGELANELKDGEKCPVCGSTHHPDPARTTPDSVSRDTWDNQEEAAKNARKAWNKAEETRKISEQELTERTNESDKKKEMMVRAGADLDAAKQALVEGIPDKDALIEAIKLLKDEVTAYEVESHTLSEDLSKKQTDYDDTKGKLSSAEAEMEKARKTWKDSENLLAESLQNNGYSDYNTVKAMLVSSEDRTAMHEELVRYDESCANTEAELKRKRAELSGKTEPDSSLFEARKAEIDEESTAFAAENSALTAKINRLDNKLKDLTEIENHYQGAIHQAESDLAFSRKLRGDTGIGLQRYILAVMFNKVIEEANRMLKNVHNGRYTLFRSDDKGEGNKRGLELKVHDSRSPGDEKGRPVSMLSGGEKFLVSLSLSIGLSTIAQRSGVQIDALFIDEGFGTLDERSIDDAMTVLDSVRKGCGTIGIISHVSVLESVIDSKLEVVKSDSGSRIKPV